uniref:Uncharacterized protein n=1 Tax=Anguilla anguilla TaxID=7936 RepID=A0A0E9QSE2_ANGAN
MQRSHPRRPDKTLH